MFMRSPQAGFPVRLFHVLHTCKASVLESGNCTPLPQHLGRYLESRVGLDVLLKPRLWGATFPRSGKTWIKE